jgi:tetratricopeptide (TPR) repeat protein
MNGRAVAIVVGVILAVVLLWIALPRDGGDDASSPQEPTPAHEAAPVLDPLDADLDALRAEGSALTLRGSHEERSPEAEAFVAHAREIGDAALGERRPDVSGQLGDILVDKGEVDFAGAVLQRAVGLMKPEDFGKDHLYALARIRRAQQRPIEAASLFERAVHVEPTEAAEFVGLSDHYLAAGRPGPARAAVSRGLRSHPDSPQLQVQGAEVALLSGELDQAQEALRPVLAADPTDFGARLIRLEVLLAAGDLDAAGTEAATLRDEVPEDGWGWIFGAAVERAGGGDGSDLLEKARELAGDCPCTREERLAIEWAAAVQPTSEVAPRAREDQLEQPASP